MLAECVFSAHLTLSSSCQSSAMPRPLCGPGVQRNSWFRFFFFGRPGRRFARAATSAWPGPVSLITYIMPSGATSLGHPVGGFGLDAQRRDAASDWTRRGRYGFGLDRMQNFFQKQSLQPSPGQITERGGVAILTDPLRTKNGPNREPTRPTSSYRTFGTF